MITALSKRISLFLCRKEIIAEEDFEIYQYGFETICSTILGFLLTILLGLLFRMFLLSIVYYVMFVAIRQFTGGYHANSYVSCNLIFSVITALVFGFTKMAVCTSTYTFLMHLLILMISSLIVWLFAPVENENKPLDAQQKKRCRIISLILTGTAAVISCFIYALSVEASVLMAFTLLFIAVLIAISKKSERK